MRERAETVTTPELVDRHPDLALNGRCRVPLRRDGLVVCLPDYQSRLVFDLAPRDFSYHSLLQESPRLQNCEPITKP